MELPPFSTLCPPNAPAVTTLHCLASAPLAPPYFTAYQNSEFGQYPTTDGQFYETNCLTTQHDELPNEFHTGPIFEASPSHFAGKNLSPSGIEPMTSGLEGERASEQVDQVTSTTSPRSEMTSSCSGEDDLYFTGPKTQHSMESVMKKSDTLWNGRGRRTNKSGKIRRRVPNATQRKAANVRERKRMLHLNDAFDSLRQCIPTFAYEKHLSRIDTLRLAMGYIRFMQDILDSPSPATYHKYANAAHEMKLKWSAKV